jgi:hypothetical protein
MRRASSMLQPPTGNQGCGKAPASVAEQRPPSMSPAGCNGGVATAATDLIAGPAGVEGCVATAAGGGKGAGRAETLAGPTGEAVPGAGLAEFEGCS